MVAEGDELGQQLATYVKTGKRVPAQLIAKVTSELLATASSGQDVLFDGLLRAMDEVEAQKPTFASFDLPLPVIIFLNLDEETAIERLSKRRICDNCHGRFPINTTEDLRACRRCGGHLIQRDDDTAEMIRQRLNWYHDDTLPVINYFREHGTVLDIDATPPIDEVTKEITAKVEEYYISKGLTPPRKDQ